MSASDLPAVHEYVGFKYIVSRDEAGHLRAVPMAQQHPAAGKDKHRRAALETYLQEHPDVPE